MFLSAIQSVLLSASIILIVILLIPSKLSKLKEFTGIVMNLFFCLINFYIEQ